jgi:hypothetical protein
MTDPETRSGKNASLAASLSKLRIISDELLKN